MLNTSEVRIAPEGRILVAPVGTTVPADASESFDEAWADLGYANEDGVEITPELEVEDFMAWQSLPPVKTSPTNLALEVVFNLIQTNVDTTSLYFFGAQWVDQGDGSSRLDVTSDINIEERALAIEWTDDNQANNRLIIPRGFVTERESLALVRSELTTFGVTFRALDDSGDFFHLLSNNPALMPESS